MMAMQHVSPVLKQTKRDQSRGQSLPEFAASLYLVVLILMVILDLGRGIYAYNTIAAAAQAGARYGLVHPDDTAGIQTAVTGYLKGLDPSRITTSISEPDSGTIIVTVTYDFSPITPLIGQLIGHNGQLTLRASAAMHQF